MERTSVRVIVAVLAILAAMECRAGEPVVLELASLNGVNGIRLIGETAGDAAGVVVAGIGDLNADGFDDVLIGASGHDPITGERAGAAYVVFGSDEALPASMQLADLDGSNGFVMYGPGASVAMGAAVGGGGDINGDGISDLIVGSREGRPGGRIDAGIAYVVFGRTTAFPAVLDVTALDGTDGFALNGILEDDHAGSWVSTIGDVNNDGVDDLAIGAWPASPSGRDRAGETYVVFGSTAGFPPSIELSSLDGTIGFAVFGVDALDWAGENVCGAGDLNADGIDDLVIGADGGDPLGRDRAGETYVIYGSSVGFPASIELASLDGTIGFTLYGAETSEGSGESVTGVGDVNGDGIDDLLIGANGQDFINDIPGKVYIVFGTDAGFPATFDLGTLDGTNGFTIHGANVGDELGYTSSGAGDANGDGVPDLLLGAFGFDTDDSNVGASYVIYGRDGAWPAELYLADLDASNGYVMTGIAEFDRAGIHVSGAGDFNGDGVDDALVGALYADAFGTSTGEAYVVFGISQRCFEGTTNLAIGDPADVLYVNGTLGSGDRTVLVRAGNLTVLSMLLPPAGGNGRFVLHGDEGRPTVASPTPLPFDVGTTCLPFLFSDGAAPVIVANNLGKRSLVGSSEFFGTPTDDPDPAATSFHLPALPLGTVVTFQALIVDPGSVSPKGVSTTNTIILEIVP